MFGLSGVTTEPTPKRKRTRKSGNDSVNSSAPDSCNTATGTQTDEDPGMRNVCQSDMLMKMNENGLVVEGGEVFRINGTDVSVGVTTVLDNDTATGSLVIGGTLMQDISVTAPINKLSVAVSNLGKKETATLKSSSILAKREKLVSAPFPLRLSVRKTLLGRSLRKEVQSALRLTSFRKNFCLGVVSPEFDIDIFNFPESMKVEYSYSAGNLVGLDSLLGKFWDVQSPSGNCNYVTKLTLKLKDLQICGKVCFARCRQALPADYRFYLSNHDVGQDAGQSDVEC